MLTLSHKIEQYFENYSNYILGRSNLNSNRTCPVCTGLPDNSVYWPDPITIFCTVRRFNQTRQGSIFLAQSRRRANFDNSHGAFRLFTVPGLIPGLFDRPHYWLSPPCTYSILCTFHLKFPGKLLPEGSREPSVEDRIHAGITVCKNMRCNLQQNKVLDNSRFRDRV